ncbi:MAG: hypothetical protein WCJ97_03780 [Phycisphaerae bacterium]
MLKSLSASLLVGLSLASLAVAADHPRLLFSVKDMDALRMRVKQEPYATMVKTLNADLDKDNWGVGPATAGYDQIMSAHRYAFMYQLTKNDAFAKKARDLLTPYLEGRNWANPRTKGLTLFVNGAYAGLVYDYCYGAPSWDDAYAKTVSAKIKQMGDVVLKSGGAEQNNSPASNWQGLRYSTGGLMMLATDEATDATAVDGAYGRVIRYLNENLGNSSTSRGWNIEGLGYTFYPMGNGVAPFLIALKRHKPEVDFHKDAPALKWTLWTTYASMVTTPTGLWRPDFGDDNPGTNGEGCYGFAFYFAPDEIKPALKFWYDRTIGIKGNRTYDAGRFGTVSSILFYPADLAEKDPMTVPAWREALADTGGVGYTVFRNHYKDNTDIVAQLYAKLRGNKGHGGPDALSFRIVGLDTIWGTGGGRYGPKTNGQDTYWRSQNTLYPVDPDARLTDNANRGKYVGKPVLNADGGGGVVMNIAQNNVGTANHTRRFFADFSQSGANAAFVISDTSDDGKFWQMATLETNKITTDKNSFTITTATGHTLKGTVLYPATTTFNVGTRLRGSDVGPIKNNNFVTCTSPDGDYLIVLTMAEKGKSHPVPTATGTWSDKPDGTVTVGKLKVTVKGDEIK